MSKCNVDFSVIYDNCTTNYYVCQYDKNNKIHHEKMFNFKQKNVKHGQGLNYVNQDGFSVMVAFDKNTDDICAILLYRIASTNSQKKYMSIDGSTTDPEHERKGLSIFIRYIAFDHEINNNGVKIICSYTVSPISEGILTNKFGFLKITDTEMLKKIYDETDEYYDTIADVDDDNFKRMMLNVKSTISNCNLGLFDKPKVEGQAGGKLNYYIKKYRKYKNRSY